jgi:hypothetical protein
MPLGTLTKAEKHKLRQLVLWLGSINDHRGGDSWGMWGKNLAPYRQLGYFTHAMKKVSNSLRHWSAGHGDWIAGHTRFATHGGRTVANSHPFQYDNLTLAHNGVLSVYGTVSGKEPEVDSDHLALYLSQQLYVHNDMPFEQVFAKVMEDVSGSVGLLMSDEFGNLRAYTSMQELHVAEGSWGYAISSSKKDLKNALSAAGLRYGSLQEVPEDTLIAPWYDGVEDFYAPAMYYSYKSKGYGRSWTDYKRSEDTLSTFNDFYKSPGTTTTTATQTGAFPSDDFDDKNGLLMVDEDLVGSRPGDWEELSDISDVPCETCGTSPIGDLPTVWTDPESGHKYLICADCAKMFEAVRGDELMTTEDLD